MATCRSIADALYRVLHYVARELTRSHPILCALLSFGVSCRVYRSMQEPFSPTSHAFGGYLSPAFQEQEQEQAGLLIRLQGFQQCYRIKRQADSKTAG